MKRFKLTVWIEAPDQEAADDLLTYYCQAAVDDIYDCYLEEVTEDEE